jgi:hypothetical protein
MLILVERNLLYLEIPHEDLNIHVTDVNSNLQAYIFMSNVEIYVFEFNKCYVSIKLYL